ncbi:UNVERIFIED_CONTAM: Heavy metal-associated isoprenylated plant protein 7 [Sesamum angustifolium]|uniref:Heavy metal-associated isoprenylated plant protein 7 n=1 Tax=Sesamum angustifolium TaxID=2727405 RepID=A0AAW2RJ67_9LAMI
MGEEEKKPEEKKPEEAKNAAEEKKEEAEKPAEDAKKEEEKKSEESKAEEQPAPPPPQEIVLKVFMHCEGCARKVRRCLKGFEGVEDVITDCRTSKVVVKGEKADPLKVLGRVQRKSHRQVELISPIPKPPAEEPKKEEKEEPKAEEKGGGPPVITVVLGVYMHCEACAQEIKKRIQRMKGVESAEPDLKSSQVTVKGVFEPEKLTDYVYKRTGKHAMIVKVEPEKKEDEKKEEEKAPEAKEEKKPEEAEAEAKKGEDAGKENKEGGDAAAATGGGEPPAKPEGEAAAAEDPKLELKKNEFYYYYPQNYQVHPQRFVQEFYAYPPQIFSDENPNACSVM